MNKNNKHKGYPHARVEETTYTPLQLSDKNSRWIKVFVEGYGDVAFWRGIFDDYETDELKFEVSVPPRTDLAKGKRVLLDMIPKSGPDMILCVDSDFDYIFNGRTEQSKLVIESPYMFQTYAYSTENYLCYPPSLRYVCAKATKNDSYIFDFVKFMAKYSSTIYPVFLWYAFSAMQKNEKMFPLNEFRSTVRLNYLDITDNGAHTISWLERQVEKRMQIMANRSGSRADDIFNFGKSLEEFGVVPEKVHMYMQGHTLLDNVVMTMLNPVCDKLREISTTKIAKGTKQGISLKNELSNYNNSTRNVREVLFDNERYKDSSQYLMLRRDIEEYIKNLH